MKFIYSFIDVTKYAKKLPTSEYLDSGKYPIIDQGQKQIAGYTDIEEGLFTDVPAIIFGDHTRVIKYIDTPFFIGADGVKVIKCLDKQANYNYLYYLLSSVRIPNTGYNRHYKWLKEAHLVEHTKEEQEKIVSVLSTIDNILNLCFTQINKLDELIKSQFVEMFGNIYSNNHKYPVESLSDSILFLTSGSRGWAKYCVDSGREWFITIKNVKDCKILTDNMQAIDAPKNAEANRTRVKEGDLLISITADLGRTGVVTKGIAEHGAYINQHLTCIRLNKTKLNPLYVAYFMESESGKPQFEEKNQNGVKAGLNFDSIKSLKVLIPPIRLQNQFADFVAKVDQQKATVQKSIDKLETLKKSLMQEYFG